jgi:Ran GTPase-activating protein (RanGAP) involved in mRNA processing and transport
MRNVLRRAKANIDVVLTQACHDNYRVALMAPSGVNALQDDFKIRRFESKASGECAELKFFYFEELCFLHLRTLRMQQNQIADMHLVALLHCFTYSREMITFEFVRQTLKTRHVPLLAHCISRFTMLQTLNLENNFLIFDSLGLLLDAVQTSTLSNLNLASNSCEDAAKMSSLCRVIEMSANTMQVLNLAYMRLYKEDIVKLVHVLQSCPLLETLDLSQNNLTYDTLIDVLQATRDYRIKTFRWGGNRLAAAGTFVLADYIAHNETWKQNLQELDLRFCELSSGMQHLGPVLQDCRSLKTLDISHNLVYAHVAANLIQNSCIASMNLHNTHMSDFGLQLIIQNAAQSNTLRQLEITGNHMSPTTVQRLRRLRRAKRMKMQVPSQACTCGTCRYL